MSHSPRLAAARPPMLPTYSVLARMPRRTSLPTQEVEADAMAADDHEVGGLERRGRAAARRPRCPASRISVCWSIVMKPSALLNVGDRAEPLPIG